MTPGSSPPETLEDLHVDYTDQERLDDEEHETKARDVILDERLTRAPNCRTARYHAAKFIQTPIGIVKDMSILSLLLRCRHMAGVKATEVCRKANVATHRKIRDLDPAERDRLSKALRPFPEGAEI